MTKDQWNDENFAAEWDKEALLNNPTRAEQLDILVSVVSDIYQQGKVILDLGIGSGLVEELLFAERPDAYIVGIDSSSAMLDIARQRLSRYSEQVTLVEHDLANIQQLTLPSQHYQIVISVQVLHHLPHQAQKDVFRYVFNALEAGGMFLLIDRTAIDEQHFSHVYRAMWNRLERNNEVKSGWSADYFLARLQDKDDYPATLEEQLKWLREVGFTATCLHFHLNRALLVGVK